MCLAGINAFAQNIPLGVAEANDMAILSAEDEQMETGQYYKHFPFELKKGDGLMVYMESTVFQPFVSIINEDTTDFISGTELPLEDGAYSCYITFKAKSDTTVFILLSSKSVNQTGSFRYVVKQFTAQQMQFDPHYTLCDRLIYLMNQWNAEWWLADKTENRDPSTGESISFIHTPLFNVSDGKVEYGTYTEVLKSFPGNASAEVAFDEYTKTFTECLAESNFQFIELMEDNKRTAWFTIAGFPHGTHSASLSLEWIYDEETDSTMIRLTLF